MTHDLLRRAIMPTTPKTNSDAEEGSGTILAVATVA